jgi:SAM-dependent methyltransferase
VSAFDLDASVAGVTGYFDELAMGEWDRHDAGPVAEVAFELHRRLLLRHIRAGMRVLEVGAGPGRFTRELAAAGATVTVVDISPVQLALNEATMREAGLADAVTDRVECDIRDVSRFTQGEFGAVVAYGGPISYTFDDAERVTAGLVGLLRPGGLLLASVMSLLGAWRAMLPGVVGILQQGTADFDAFERVWASGDTRHLPHQRHVCRCFRAHEVSAMLDGAGAEVLELSATGWAVHSAPEAVEWMRADPERWHRFVDLEERSAATPGALDGGTHIMFAARAR